MKAGTNWMTSFFYKEDLRSEYMNGVLEGAFRPGVYNGNLAILTTNTSVKLYVKQGTTLLFGNSYRKKGSKYFLDLDAAGSFLIKCTAKKDFTEDLLVFSSSTAPSEYVKSILGYKQQGSVVNTAPEFSFVYADILYYPDQVTETGSVEPRFRISLKSEDSEEGWYSCPDVPTTETTTVNRITENMIVRNSNHAYLFLGALEDCAYEESLVYLDGYAWNDQQRKTWVLNHRFVARGLSEYRGNYIKSSKIKNAEVFLGGSRKNIYLDAQNFIIEDKLYSEASEIDDPWLFKITDDKSKKDFGIKEWTDEDLAKLNPENEYILVDLGFLGTRAKYSGKEQDLSNIFEESSDLIKVSYSFATLASTNISLDPSRDEEGITGEHLDYYSGEGENLLKDEEIITLDLNEVNQKRLISLIENKNIFSTAINKMIYDGLINPKDITNLSPLFIAFRKVIYLNDEWVSIIPQDTKILSEVNPSNFISFLSLQNSAFKANIVEMNRPDIYTVLPVID